MCWQTLFVWQIPGFAPRIWACKVLRCDMPGFLIRGFRLFAPIEGARPGYGIPHLSQNLHCRAQTLSPRKKETSNLQTCLTNLDLQSILRMYCLYRDNEYWKHKIEQPRVLFDEDWWFAATVSGSAKDGLNAFYRGFQL